MAGTSFLMFHFLSKSKSSAEVEASRKVQEERLKPGHPYDMGEAFIVNLLGSRRFLKVGVVLEAEKEEILTELTERSAQMRDVINEILRAQKLEDVEDPTLKNLKSQILGKINLVLTKGKIRSVWFTQFQIQ
jgi:flagellar FliL protein